MAYHEVFAPFGDGANEAMATLYPELRGRTLGEFLRAELSGEPTIFVNIEDDENEMTSLCVMVAGKNRKSQVYLAAQERLIMSDLWEMGVCIGNAASPSFPEIIAFFRLALSQNLALASIEDAAPCFRSSENGLAQEKGAKFYVDEAWEKYAELLRAEPANSRMGALAQLLEATSQVPELRCLMVYTSMYWFCLSRCTGYPFSDNCPYAVYNQESDLYEVYAPSRVDPDSPEQLVGTGNATEAAQMLADALPPDCGPAILGTADDLK